MGRAFLWEHLLEKCSLVDQDGDRYRIMAFGWAEGRVNETNPGSSPVTDLVVLNFQVVLREG
jgi:hypothetical protein